MIQVGFQVSVLEVRSDPTTWQTRGGKELDEERFVRRKGGDCKLEN